MMGGQGTRMGGRDKSQLELNHQSFRNILVERMQARFQWLALCTGQKKDPDERLPQLLDELINGKQIGPAGGLLAASKWAGDLGLDGIVTIPVDTPILPENIFERLILETSVSYVYHVNRSHWLHAAWPTEKFKLIEQSIRNDKNYTLRCLHEAIGSHAVRFQTSQKGAFHNINTEKDLVRAQSYAPS